MRRTLAFAIILAAFGCAAQGPPALRVVDALAEEATLTLLPGEILFLRLPGSPRLVRAWREERGADPRILLFREATVSEVRGAEGFRAPKAFEIWEFVANGPGRTDLVLRAEGDAVAAAEAAGWAKVYRLKVAVIGSP
ncbi:MAG: hypothetical protein JXP34_26005 [Planctomycetes bacterium]|nr:hypothetical protein [Planctomycetota bacterium]